MNCVLLVSAAVLASACSSAPSANRSDHRDGGSDGSPIGRRDGDATQIVDSSQVDDRLCDGIQHLQLWALVEPALSRELPGSQVRVENGSPFLMVDGSCSYWISGGWIEDPLSRDEGIRGGMLASSDKAMLEDALPLANMDSLGDCAPVAGEADKSVRALSTRFGSARCSSEGVRFDEAWAKVHALAQTLWDRGEELAGAIHINVTAAPYDASTSPRPYVWPLSKPLDTFMADPGKDNSNLLMAGVSHLVDDSASADALRALRDQYLMDRREQPGLYVSWDGLKSGDGTTIDLVYLRDAVPYEDETGLVHF